MMLLGLLAGYFTLFSAGIGCVLVLVKPSTRLNVVELACLSWLLGVGIVSLLLWLGGIVFSGLALQSLVTLTCLVLGFIGWMVKKRRAIHFSLPRPDGSLEWILASLLVIELVAIFFVSLKHTLGWDGLLNWEIKARYAFFNSGVLPRSYYSSYGRAFSHPEYPLAIPFTELWLYLWMGAAHQFWIKTIFPAFYISGALLVTLFISRLTGKRWAGLTASLLMPFVPFVTASPGGVIVGYADIFLSMAYVVALGYLLCSFEFDSPFALLAYGSVLTLIPWIKSEGMILWSVLAVIGLVAGFVRHRLRPYSIAILPGLVLIVSWRLYLRALHVVPASDFVRPSLQLLSSNLVRVPSIGRIALAELTDFGLWSIFWLLTIVAIVYLVTSRTLSRLVVTLSILSPVVLYLLAYVFSAWPSYTAHITSSLPRLLLQVVPVGWLAIGLALACSKAEPGKSAFD